jgi:hypothetical protein
VVQSQEQPHTQAEGIQPDDVPSNEHQQLIMVGLPFHQIPAKREERMGPQVLSTSRFLTPQQLSQ